MALSLYVQFVFNYVAICLEGLTSLTSYTMMDMSYSYAYGVTCCVVYWFTKYPLTTLHICKYAVTSGLKKFDHFRRGSLSSFLLIL